LFLQDLGVTGVDNVLIVDDNKLAIEIIDDLLTTWGYRTKVCSNSLEVFNCVLDFKPDVILLDVMLPGMNGFAICNKLKTFQETQKIPIIILTALNDMENRIHAFNMGADAFLSKPIKYEELKNRVEWAVRYKKSLEVMEPEDAVVKTLLNILQAMNYQTYLHSVRLSHYCESVGRILYVIDEDMNQLVVGGFLHDIGKIVTDDPQGHIDAGLKIISGLNMHTWLDRYVRSHHEKLNGEGYPDRLISIEMPLNLRILVTVNRFMELAEECGDDNEAFSTLKEECKKGYWSTEVLDALKQVIRDADFKKRIVSM